MDSFQKQVREVRDINFDFRPWLALRPGVTPTNFTPTVDTGLTIVGASMSDEGVVKVVVSGGVDRSKYKVSVLLETNTPQKREADCYVYIREL